MPKGMKAGITAIIVLLVGGLTLWNRSPLHPNLAGYLVALAVGVVAAMWIFPNVKR